MSALYALDAPWEVVSLESLCSGGDASIQTGPFGSQLHASDYVEDGIPCVMPQDIRDGRVSTENIARISEADHRRLNRFQLREGDIVYPRRGDISKRALIGERESGWLCGTGCLRIRPNVSSVKPSYLAYYLSHPDVCAWIEGNAVGATMPHLNTGLAGSIPVVRPPVIEQREIAAVLDALDDKIALNRRTAATLEAMARALYQSWFVEFDPVHAKAVGQPPTRMDETTAALFPDSFTEDGLPEGWTRATLAKVADLNAEKHSKKKHPDEIEYVDLSNTKWGIIETTSFHMWETAPSRARMALFEGDTVVGTVRPGNGSYAYIYRSGLTGSTGFAVLSPKNRRDAAFVYLTVTDPSTIEALSNLADGGAYPAVRPEVVVTQETVVPDALVLSAFASEVMPLIERIEAGKRENQTLARLRDTLLPRLMSGALRVGKAREQAEAAT